ncbi:methyltransferase [Holotrichia oblita]|uniref:Methyltransferase n=1 Tax=Holotrichia oblita TaxID=644536 RepID=A0ACB9TKE6_HOLOL|nr:methyltransferase [Holotrichia oblita]
MSTQIPTSVDESEIQHFKKQSANWWHPNASLKLLRAMNSVRVSLVMDGLIDTEIARKELRNTAVPLTGLKVLDVGCGVYSLKSTGGFLTEALAKLGCIVTGIDPCEDLIAIAIYHASQDETLKNLTYISTTIEKFVENNSEQFDAVVTSEVVEHVNNQVEFITKCVKCVKPGRSIFITTINKTIWSRIIAIWLGEYILRLIPRGTHEYQKFISPKDVEDILKEST